jgi:uncharacterized protein YbcI
MFKDYFGKGPESAKSYIIDDLLFVVMRGGLTAAEQFLLEQGEADVVRQYRQVFENHMDRVLSDKIEAITGRKVIGFQSQVLFDPDMSIEIFIFDDRGTADAVEATARGQIADEPIGEAADEEPAGGGGSAELDPG